MCESYNLFQKLCNTSLFRLQYLSENMHRTKEMNTKLKGQNRNYKKSNPTFPQWAKLKKEMLNSFPSAFRGV